jgi:hypothetical protein
VSLSEKLILEVLPFPLQPLRYLAPLPRFGSPCRMTPCYFGLLCSDPGVQRVQFLDDGRQPARVVFSEHGRGFRFGLR